MIDVDTSIEPPSLNGEEEDRPILMVRASICEFDDTTRSSDFMMQPDATDTEIAAAILATALAVARLRSPGVLEELHRQIAAHSREPGKTS